MNRGPRRITIYSDKSKGIKVFFRFEDGLVKLVIFDKNTAVSVFRIQNSKVRKLLNWLRWMQGRE